MFWKIHFVRLYQYTVQQIFNQSTCNFSLQKIQQPHFIQPENFTRDQNFDNHDYAEQRHKIHVKNVYNNTKYYKSLALMLYMANVAYLCC